MTAFLGPADDRALGIAYAEIGDPRAREYLARARPADAAVLGRLAPLEGSQSMYEALLREDPSNPTALVNLGVLYGHAGRARDAARMWQRALETNPAIEAAALNLSQVLPAVEARAVLERYLQFNPGSKAARARLSALN